MTSSTHWRWLRSGKCTGRIFGSCLPCIHQLDSSKYMPDYTSRILVLETPEFNEPNQVGPLYYVSHVYG
jgi:muramoyltetrapeptide carboxypeptidase LdcA involved in peptidoglycan recycling